MNNPQTSLAYNKQQSFFFLIGKSVGWDSAGINQALLGWDLD